MSETILEPDLPIVDPHHHLWDLRSTSLDAGQPLHGAAWTKVEAGYYLFDQLLADVTSGHNVRATIHLTCDSMWRADGPPAFRPLGETEFVNGVAAMSASGKYGDVRLCDGIVGHVDFTNGRLAREVLEAHVRIAGGRFKGIRHRASWDADPEVMGRTHFTPAGLYLSDVFREGFAELGRLGLSFDAWLLEPQLDDLIDLARAFPGTSIVLDHLGTPLGVASYAGRLPERFDIWRDKIRRLAELPNLMVKLGGLGMHFLGFDTYRATPRASSEQLAAQWKPYIETAIEAFGAQRCMFESNFPVDSLTCDYVTLWNAYKRIAAACSADEKAALFAGSAARFYRLIV